MFEKNELKQGFIDAIPIGLSLVVFGAIFGVMSIQADLSIWESVVMSLIVFAGSAQFASLSLISEDVYIWTIVLTTFLINSRHLLMGLSMSPYYTSFPKWYTNILAFFLIDEQYAITLHRFKDHRPHLAYIISVSLTLYITWFIGTVLGGFVGALIPDPGGLGLGFSFTAMFLSLVYFQLSSRLRVFTFIVCGALAVFLVSIIPSGLNLLVAGMIAFLFGYFFEAEKEM